MAHDVFISHSNKDKAVADATCARLEHHGIRCWVAPRDIRPGADWTESILQALEASSVMVLILSANANGSGPVKREVERAAHYGKVIIPFRIEDVMPSKALEFTISTAHWLDAFSPPLEQHLDRLAATIHGVLNVSSADTLARETKAAPPRRTWKTATRFLSIFVPEDKMVVFTLCAAIAIITGLALYFSGQINKLRFRADDDEIRRDTEVSAEKGDVNAENNLGYMYEKGESGLPQDYAQALTWFQKSADKGNSAAQYNIGFMYENGWAVSKDLNQAVSWYRKAAGHDSSDAVAALKRLGYSITP